MKQGQILYRYTIKVRTDGNEYAPFLFCITLYGNANIPDNNTGIALRNYFGNGKTIQACGYGVGGDDGKNPGIVTRVKRENVNTLKVYYVKPVFNDGNSYEESSFSIGIGVKDTATTYEETCCEVLPYAWEGNLYL